MKLQISFEEFTKFIETNSFVRSGASTEKAYSRFVIDGFPNCQVYWNKFIVPSTNRISKDARNETDNRESIDNDLLDIGSIHYSIFIYLVYAQFSIDQIHKGNISPWFENFYSYMGTICDLTESFFVKVYQVSLRSTILKSKVYEKLSEEQFLTHAKKFYVKNYDDYYENYWSVGKPFSIEVKHGSYLVREYLGKVNWILYENFATAIRKYRNIVVHDHVMMSIGGGSNDCVPTKEKVKNYKEWRKVIALVKTQDRKTFEEDFVERKLLIKTDLNRMKTILNELWTKPISDMNKLLYVDKNEILLEMYNMEFV